MSLDAYSGGSVASSQEGGLSQSSVAFSHHGPPGPSAALSTTQRSYVSNGNETAVSAVNPGLDVEDSIKDQTSGSRQTSQAIGEGSVGNQNGVKAIPQGSEATVTLGGIVEEIEEHSELDDGGIIPPQQHCLPNLESGLAVDLSSLGDEEGSSVSQRLQGETTDGGGVSNNKTKSRQKFFGKRNMQTRASVKGQQMLEARIVSCRNESLCSLAQSNSINSRISTVAKSQEGGEEVESKSDDNVIPESVPEKEMSDIAIEYNRCHGQSEDPAIQRVKPNNTWPNLETTQTTVNGMMAARILPEGSGRSYGPLDDTVHTSVGLVPDESVVYSQTLGPTRYGSLVESNEADISSAIRPNPSVSVHQPMRNAVEVEDSLDDQRRSKRKDSRCGGSDRCSKRKPPNSFS